MSTTQSTREDRGYELTWHQRHFLNTHGPSGATAFVDRAFDDGQVRIVVRHGARLDAFIVDVDGVWWATNPDTAEVAWGILAGSMPAGLSADAFGPESPTVDRPF